MEAPKRRFSGIPPFGNINVDAKNGEDTLTARSAASGMSGYRRFAFALFQLIKWQPTALLPEITIKLLNRLIDPHLECRDGLSLFCRLAISLALAMSMVEEPYLLQHDSTTIRTP